jgi:hypothetical protein
MAAQGVVGDGHQIKHPRVRQIDWILRDRRLTCAPRLLFVQSADNPQEYISTCLSCESMFRLVPTKQRADVTRYRVIRNDLPSAAIKRGKRMKL